MTKRILCVILILPLLCGCSRPLGASDVSFYYPKAAFSYNDSDGAIGVEIRNNGSISSSARLLDLYLEGPVDEKLRNPFPEDVTTVSFYTLENTVYVTLSDSMAVLSGASLILACSCVGRTAMELAGVSSAQIQCENLLLDGKAAIIISENTVFYSDTYHSSLPEVE